MKISVKVSHFLHPFMALFISQSPWQWQSPWQLPKSGHMTLQTLSNHSFHGLSSASSKHFL